jgi:dihydropteroate synthase
MRLRCREFTFEFPRPALVMGIVNVTPDSFSDGGRFFEPEKAVAHGLRLVEEGADILDIGGESTRPNAAQVSEEEELRRVLPVIRALAREVRVPLSIDTMKPGVARAALEAGASIVNDVAANRNDPEMWREVAATGAGYVCLHMQGTPQTMQAGPQYEDVRRQVGEFFFERLERLNGCGVAVEQIILDVGIGFGKTLEHNLELLGGLDGFRGLGRPLLLGVSQKSFIGKLLGVGAAERLPGALACAVLAVDAGVRILRVHEVAPTVQAVRMAEAILARRVKTNVACST